MIAVLYDSIQENPKQFLNTPDEELSRLLPKIRDPNLRNTLEFGIGLHHAGLHEDDRKIVEMLFCEQKILVCSKCIA
jgi:activating signal cointegrator complex subunit 3